MFQFANLKEAEQALEPFLPARLNRVAYTTEHIAQFMDYLGNPQDLPRAIHIAGTSGKTSTAYYSAALLTAAGKKTGLLVSPHLEKITERVQINMQPLSDRQFCDELAIFLDYVQKSGITLSYAELLYGFAFWEFARQGVEYIVVEVGLGGLLDATNVIHRPDKICVITDIGLDHTKALGGTIENIAEHKAGIILRGNAVFTYKQDMPVIKVIQDTVRQKQADLHTIDETTDEVVEPLPLFQQHNFGLAEAAVSFALERRDGTRLSQKMLHAAATTAIPGRMEVREIPGHTVVLDGAHNPQKLHALRLSMKKLFPNEPIAALVGFSGKGDRSLEEMLVELQPLVTMVIITELHDDAFHMSRPAADIAAVCDRLGIKYSIAEDQLTGVSFLLERPEKVMLVTGSLYLIGQLRPHFVGIKS